MSSSTSDSDDYDYDYDDDDDAAATPSSEESWEFPETLSDCEKKRKRCTGSLATFKAGAKLMNNRVRFLKRRMVALGEFELEARKEKFFKEIDGALVYVGKEWKDLFTQFKQEAATKLRLSKVRRDWEVGRHDIHMTLYRFSYKWEGLTINLTLRPDCENCANQITSVNSVYTPAGQQCIYSSAYMDTVRRQMPEVEKLMNDVLWNHDQDDPPPASSIKQFPMFWWPLFFVAVTSWLID